MAKKTAAQLVAYANSMIGHPYWYGTYGQVATAALLRSKTAQYPSQYPSGMNAQRQSDIAKKLTVVDCSGFLKGFGWMDASGKVVYASNGVKDTNANGLYSGAKIKGSIGTLPDTPGLGLWHDGHVGVYIGGGYAVEARGRNYGVVRTKVDARAWTNWFQITFIDYSESAPPQSNDVFGESALTSGDRGENVKTLQTLLNKVGANLSADGIYGAKTAQAVKAYQARIGAAQTGVADTDTIKRLLSDATDDKDDGDTGGDASMIATVKITVTGGTVNIRKGPGKDQFASVGLARKGDALMAIAGADGTAAVIENWCPVVMDGAVYWISRSYVAE